MFRQLADAEVPSQLPVAIVASLRRVVLIPLHFAVDGKGFMYFLKSNDIEFQRSEVQVIEEDKPPVRMQEYFFTSQRTYEDAESVWYNLTGCQELGKINEWQKWSQFK